MSLSFHVLSQRCPTGAPTSEAETLKQHLQVDAELLAVAAARAASDKLGKETIVMDVGDVLAITGYFVVTSGANKRQVKALAEAVEEAVDRVGGPKPIRIEGLDALEWLLMDYGGFVVHVFNEEARAYYSLERLWNDVPRVEWEETPVL